MPQNAPVAHSQPAWSSSTNTTTNGVRPSRPSILQRISGFGNKQPVQSHMCGSVMKFTLNSDGAGEPSIYTGESKEGDQSDMNTVVTVYYHPEYSCYEVVTYDILKKSELNRLYVPHENVADLTEKKKSRLSFIGRRSFNKKKMSLQFGELMAVSLDNEQKPSVDILRPDVKNRGRKQSIAFPKPDNLVPATMNNPKFNKDGSLAPIGQRASILQRFGRKLSIFGGRSTSPPIAPTSSAATPFETIQENRSSRRSANSEDNAGSGRIPPKLSEVPQSQSSTDLTHNLKYDKGVDEMLNEAAQMRADLAAKRAAKGEDGEKRFGKKKRSL